VEKNGQNQNSALSTIAHHERELLARSKQGDRDAERIVAEARLEARRIAEAEAERLSSEIVAIRKEGEAVRDRERLDQQHQAEQRLIQLRADAKTRANAVAGAVISLVLPASSGGSP
jgi:vacuolar-type H+-ATPase subunit H